MTKEKNLLGLKKIHHLEINLIKSFSKILVVLTVVFAFCNSALAQKTKFIWNDLSLGVSTPKNAIDTFGKPAKDKDKVSLRADLEVGSWLSEKRYEKAFRVMEYKKLNAYENVRLAFLDEKLAVIFLEFPNALFESEVLDPDELGSVFALKFTPWKRAIGHKLPSLREFQEESSEDLKKDDYDYWYNMVGISDNQFVVAKVNNYKNIEGIIDRDKRENDRRKQINSNGKYPGYVQGIQIISRTLESK